MDNLIIADSILAKLKDKHQVCRREVEQCFENRAGKLLQDKRAQHRTNPPTLWFIGTTNKGRELKVVYIQEGPHIHLRTCYPPNPEEVRIYNKYAL